MLVLKAASAAFFILAFSDQAIVLNPWFSILPSLFLVLSKFNPYRSQSLRCLS